MADVELVEVGQRPHFGNVDVADAVAGVDVEAVFCGEAGCADEALELAGLVCADGVGVGAGVELDDLSPDAMSGVYLLQVGVNEGADDDFCGGKFADDALEPLGVGSISTV